jgi:cell division protein FtsZ
LRVTVIATGVGPLTDQQQQQQQQERAAMKVIQNPAVEKNNKMSDYREFDKPTVTRLHNNNNDSSLDDHENHDTQSGDYLDIPAFLRRQAD